MNPPLRAASFDDFGFDTLTLAECWPWLKGAFIVVAGSIVAGFVGLFTWFWAPAWSLPSRMDGVDHAI